LAALIAQVVLGATLTPSDFAAYATALAVTGVLGSGNMAGVDKILIQRGGEVNSLARPLLVIAFAVNTILFASILAITPIAAYLYGKREFFWLMPILAAPLLVMPLGAIQRIRLAVGLRLSTTAIVSGISGLIRSASAISFALVGFGAASLALPILVGTAFEWFAFRFLAGPIPPGRPLSAQLCGQVLMAARWVVLGSLAIAIIANGDYVVISAFKPDKETLGIYFFGYQLTLAISAPFSVALLGVLTPTMSKLSDPERRRAAYLRAVRMLAFAVAPPCVALAIIAGPTVRILWGGKWDSCVPVVQVMALTLIISMIGPLAIATFEAFGRWRTRAAMLIADAGGVLVATGIGCVLGDAFAIAICVGVHRVIIGLAQGAVAAWHLNSTTAEFVSALLPPVVTAIVVGGVSIFLVGRILPAADPYLQSVFLLFCFLVLTLCTWRRILRSRYAEVIAVTGLGGRMPIRFLS